jgi:hypothetical protein
MLRNIRLRLRLVPKRPIVLPKRSFGKYFTPEWAVKDEFRPVDLWGNDYGPGPSSLPYAAHDSPHDMFDPESAALERLDRQSGIRKLFDGNEGMSQVLIDLSLGDISMLLWEDLSESEISAVLRFLVVQGRSVDVAHIMIRLIQVGLAKDSEVRLRFDMGLIDSVFQTVCLSGRLLSDRPGERFFSSRAVPSGRDDLDLCIELHSALQSVRHQRDDFVYGALITRCMLEGLPDEAAKIFAGQVEEWIIEGRVAEGAEPEHFYEGGGPHRQGREVLEARSDLLKVWWKGVRSWALPGEVLSPHDRLDLWHPKRLALPDKLRRFPFPVPSSPPSLVPAPSLFQLLDILNGLELENDETELFRRSMRACAHLSSTVLNRTIPYISQGHLVNKLLQAPPVPAVYPEYIDPATLSENDKWAYTAYVHIHLAIKSMVLFPPQAPELIAYMKEWELAKRDGTEPPQPPARKYSYMTGPLSYTMCLDLIRWTMIVIRRVNPIRPLLNHIKERFGSKEITEVYNFVLRWTTILRDNKAAGETAAHLFRGSFLTVGSTTASAIGWFSPGTPHDPKTLSIPEPTVPTEPDEQSVVALLMYFIASGDKERFFDTVCQINPFLKFSDSRPFDTRGSELNESAPHELPEDASKNPTLLSPGLYAVILNGCEKFRLAGLGRRTFNLALQAERGWLEAYPSGEDVPVSQQLPVYVYTSVIKLFDKQRRVASHEVRNEAWKKPGYSMYPFGWKPPRGHELSPRDLASYVMIRDTYQMAREKWRKAGWDPITSQFKRRKPVTPDAYLFNAMIRAMAERWGLQNYRGDWAVGLISSQERLHRNRLTTKEPEVYDVPVSPQVESEMVQLIQDMEDFNFTVPPGLLIRLGLKKRLRLKLIGKDPKSLAPFYLVQEVKTKAKSTSPLGEYATVLADYEWTETNPSCKARLDGMGPPRKPVGHVEEAEAGSVIGEGARMTG